MHDHQRNAIEEESKDERASFSQSLRKPLKESKKLRRIKEAKKNLFQEMKYLRDTCSVPMTSIAKRLKMKYEKLRRILKSGV